MRALLDVNVLVALLDADHVHHRIAYTWFCEHGHGGWASTAITQNGCVRILCHPGYLHPIPVSQVVQRLREATQQPGHEYWPGAVSLLDQQLIDVSRIHGPRQLTDTYLLALAVGHGGRLVTFDNAIDVKGVNGARTDHLVIL
jgi:hypothetical protein